jgi:hypothetical protein
MVRTPRIRIAMVYAGTLERVVFGAVCPPNRASTRIAGGEAFGVK